MKDMPVLLLTGYLGSGKTTLVNSILNNRKGIKFAVIVNDIGEVNIDADLIQKGGVVGKKDESLVALQNGCICCTLKMDLVEQLGEITAMGRFDYIVIEASGICEPAPIAQTICSIPGMGPQYVKDGYVHLDCIVTVVDALRMRDEFSGGGDLLKRDLAEDDIENLIIQQVEFCNIVLLNKASEVSPEELGRLRSIVRTLQPKAEIIECDWCGVDLDKLLDTGMFDFDEVAGSARWVSEVEGHHDDDDDDDDDDGLGHGGHEGHEDHAHGHGDGHGDGDEHGHEHEHGHVHEHEGGHGHHHHHHEGGEVEEYGIGTYVYYARRPFDLARFDDFVAKKWPAGVIRAKGICYFETETDICYLFEQAGKQVSLRNVGQWFATMPPYELQMRLAEDEALRRDWDERYGDRMQKLVFIGQHLDKDAIKDALDACLGTF